MSSSAPELQQKLFKRMGLDVPEPRQQARVGGSRRPGQKLSRKEQRKAQRVQRRTHIYSRPTPTEQRVQSSRPQKRHNGVQNLNAQQNRPQPKPSRSAKEEEDDIEEEVDEDEDEGEDEGMGDDISLGETEDEHGLEEDMDEDESEAKDDVDESQAKANRKGLSRAAQERLAEDDAEIEEFERKLGIKKGRKSLPQAFKEDGLDELLGETADMDSDVDQSDDDKRKRKSEYDDWLASKRRKTAEAAKPKRSRIDSDDDEDEDEDLDLEGDSEDDDLDLMDDDDEGQDAGEYGDDESFDGFDDDGPGQASTRPRQRENPYVAPTTGVTVAKYVPPSLRKAAGTEVESRSRLRKQLQGLVNRLTDANILSIVQSVEELYSRNARGDVTDIITDIIMAQICKSESLPDQFFVLTGGFAAAIYRIIGSSFGSHLIRRIVSEFGTQYEQASQGKDFDVDSAIQKQASNILTLLSQMYIFEVVSCKIMFDYMERLLDDLNEINVELLLRICRMAGRLLRKDDPQALKHVSTVLNQSVSKAGYVNVSARTKFMVETIADLKNAKPKARGMDSAVVSEHVQRMKKRLGELKSQTRRLDGLAPMGVGLGDIEGAETQGKWWLVGASVPVKPEKGPKDSDDAEEEAYESSNHEDMDIVMPDYPKKARAQGLNGTAQIAIFTALMSASNYDHGYRQFLNLKLKRDDQLEIAKVLVQCVGSEMQYNSYYALVGRQACLQSSKVRFALQDRLWRIFRSLGESLFGEQPDDDDTADGERMKDERRLGNVARFYAQLVIEGSLSINVLKPLELPELNHWTSTFVQLFMIALLKECRSKDPSEDVKVDKIFGGARELPGLAAGIHWMLRKKIRKTKLIGGKGLKKLDAVREKAQIVVQAVATAE